MMKWIGAALFAATMMFGVSVQVSPAAAGGGMQTVQTRSVTDISARRHTRQYRYANRPYYYPAYYGRPTYYAPAPFLPIPPFFGYGWEWW